jgi:DNA polymerase lambda
MPREECTEILAEVRRAADAVGSELEVIGCGSYRRGKATCGDLDVLVTHEDEAALEGVFEAILNHLRESKFLTDDLSIQRDGRQRKYLGVCRLPGVDRLHRRLDIIVVPPDERSAALLYFTGSAHFNRSMRLLAGKMGMSLSEHALTANVLRHKREKINEGAALPTPTEKSIFEVTIKSLYPQYFSYAHHNIFSIVQALGLAYRPPEERNH